MVCCGDHSAYIAVGRKGEATVGLRPTLGSTLPLQCWLIAPGNNQHQMPLPKDALGSRTNRMPGIVIHTLSKATLRGTKITFF